MTTPHTHHDRCHTPHSFTITPQLHPPSPYPSRLTCSCCPTTWFSSNTDIGVDEVPLHCPKVIWDCQNLWCAVILRGYFVPRRDHAVPVSLRRLQQCWYPSCAFGVRSDIVRVPVHHGVVQVFRRSWWQAEGLSLSNAVRIFLQTSSPVSPINLLCT